MAITTHMANRIREGLEEKESPDFKEK